MPDMRTVLQSLRLIAAAPFLVIGLIGMAFLVIGVFIWGILEEDEKELGGQGIGPIKSRAM